MQMTFTAMYSSLPEHHPIFAQIGRIASAWSHFEQELDQAIIAVSGLDEQKCQCILAQFMSSSPRIRAFIALCRDKGIDDPRWFKDAEDFLQKNNGVSELRNRVVHDPWMYDAVAEATLQRSVISERNKPRVSVTLVERTHDDLIAIIKKIDRHVLRFRKLCEDLRGINSNAMAERSPLAWYVPRSINPDNPNGGTSVIVKPMNKEQVESMLALKAALDAQRDEGE